MDFLLKHRDLTLPGPGVGDRAPDRPGNLFTSPLPSPVSTQIECLWEDWGPIILTTLLGRDLERNGRGSNGGT